MYNRTARKGINPSTETDEGWWEKRDTDAMGQTIKSGAYVMFYFEYQMRVGKVGHITQSCGRAKYTVNCEGEDFFFIGPKLLKIDPKLLEIRKLAKIKAKLKHDS